MPTVLVTGANRGIGLELARQYAAAGHDVIATARTPASADALNETGVEVHALDVGDDASVAALKETLGDRPIDILLNNAGIGSHVGIGRVDSNEFADVLNVNTIGPMRMIEAFSDNVAAGDGKMIATVSSQMGSIESTTRDFGLIYRTSKAGANMALRAAATALSERDITMLTLHPGWVKTDMGGEQAPVAPADSAAGLIKVIDEAGPAKELRFLDWQGQTLPW